MKRSLIHVSVEPYILIACDTGELDLMNQIDSSQPPLCSCLLPSVSYRLLTCLKHNFPSWSHRQPTGQSFLLGKERIGSGWDEIPFPHSSPPSAVFCIGNQIAVGNTPAFFLLLISALTASRLSLQHSTSPVVWRRQCLGRGHRQDNWLKLIKGGIWYYDICLLEQLVILKPYFLVSG